MPAQDQIEDKLNAGHLLRDFPAKGKAIPEHRRPRHAVHARHAPPQIHRLAERPGAERNPCPKHRQQRQRPGKKQGQGDSSQPPNPKHANVASVQDTQASTSSRASRAENRGSTCSAMRSAITAFLNSPATNQHKPCPKARGSNAMGLDICGISSAWWTTGPAINCGKKDTKNAKRRKDGAWRGGSRPGRRPSGR